MDLKRTTCELPMVKEHNPQLWKAVVELSEVNSRANGRKDCRTFWGWMNILCDTYAAYESRPTEVGARLYRLQELEFFKYLNENLEEVEENLAKQKCFLSDFVENIFGYCPKAKLTRIKRVYSFRRQPTGDKQ